MKTFLLLMAAICCCFFSYSQTTITLQPTPAQGKDAEIFSCVPCGYDNSNFGTKRDFDAIAWTNSGNLSKVRSLIQFDLSMIPTNALVTDAKLSLFYNTSSSEGQHAGTNASYFQRILAPWSETTVTWNNQPPTTTTGQILLPTSTSNTQNYININITSFVMDMVANPSANFGFMLKLANETVSKKLILSSSDHLTPAMRPLLVITYTAPLPVSLLYLNAEKTGNSNKLTWATASEVNNQGFQIERSENDELKFEQIGFIKGSGTSSIEQQYEFYDNTAIGFNTYYYRLKQVDFDGHYVYSQPVKINGSVVMNTLTIGPNPFSETTDIAYTLDGDATVNLAVFDATGRMTDMLVNESQAEGTYKYQWAPASDCKPSSIFFVRLLVNNNITTRKLLFSGR
jgi:hypothetical protein